MKLNNFFIWCSGASIEIVNMCDDKEKSKYTNIGIVVFAVALLSTLSSTFFLSFAFDKSGNDFNLMYFPIGIIWGFIILSLDRAIVSTINKNDNWFVQIIKSIPRFILALTIGIILATPLEFKIFEKEINQIIDNNVLEIVKSDKLNKYQSELKLLENNLKETESIYLQNKKMYSDEVDGVKSGIPGKGARANEYMKNELSSLRDYNLARKELETFNVSLVNNEKQIDFDKEVKEYKDENIGILDRVEVLYSIGPMHTIISILFILIEILPLLIKLLSSKGSYDEITLTQHTLKVQQSKNSLDLILKNLNKESTIFDTDMKLIQDKKDLEREKELELLNIDYDHNIKIKQEEKILDYDLKKAKIDKNYKTKLDKLNTIEKTPTVVAKSAIVKNVEKPVIFNKTWFLTNKINYVFKRNGNLHIFDDGAIKNGKWTLNDTELIVIHDDKSMKYKVATLTEDKLILSTSKHKLVLTTTL